MTTVDINLLDNELQRLHEIFRICSLGITDCRAAKSKRSEDQKNK